MKFENGMHKSLGLLVLILVLVAGAPTQAALQKGIINVKGMYCGGCAVSVSKALKGIGVESKVDHITGKVMVKYPAHKVTMKQMRTAIEKLGYQCPISQTK